LIEVGAEEPLVRIDPLRGYGEPEAVSASFEVERSNIVNHQKRPRRKGEA